MLLDQFLLLGVDGLNQLGGVVYFRHDVLRDNMSSSAKYTMIDIIQSEHEEGFIL